MKKHGNIKMLGALGCMNNEEFEKNYKWHIAYRAHFSTSVSACGTHSDAILCKWSSLKILWMVHFSMPVSAYNSSSSIPFCTTLDLQLSFYRSLCYKRTAHCPLLKCLHTTSAILAGPHSYLVVSSFKCEWKNSCYDLISTLVSLSWIFIAYLEFKIEMNVFEIIPLKYN